MAFGRAAKTKGQFSKLSERMTFDESDLQNSRVEVSAEAASIHTGMDTGNAPEEHRLL